MANASERASEIGARASDLADDAKDYARAEIAALREKVEALMSERVTPALAGAAGRAEEAAHSAAEAMRRQTDHIKANVREQPLIALGAAALAGIAIGLLLRR